MMNDTQVTNNSSKPRLFLDVTDTELSPLKTGIQRVAIELFKWLMRLHPMPANVVPVTLHESEGQLRHTWAIAFEQRVLGSRDGRCNHECIRISSQDTLLHLDFAPAAVYHAYQQGLYARYQAQGIRTYSLIYDLLPVRFPEFFPPNMAQHHRNLLKAVASFDGALCISNHVADELKQWYLESKTDVKHLRIGTFKLGADVGAFKSASLTEKLHQPPKLKRFGLACAKSFLMVGTIEPRKGYDRILDAFDALWRQGGDQRLIIIGREGWTDLPNQWRAPITSVCDRLTHHPERFKKLIWLRSADDEQLELAYRQADCLIAASYGEGFGLPIIESAQHGVPVLARDIPVFREVAPAGTVFFTQDNLAHLINQWQPPPFPTHETTQTTWEDSARMVLKWLGQPAELNQTQIYVQPSN